MTAKPKKRRRRIDPKKTGEAQIAKSIYFYTDEHEMVLKAATEEGISVSAFATRAAIEKAAALLSNKPKS